MSTWLAYGTKVVEHAGYVNVQMAEVIVPRELKPFEWTELLKLVEGFAGEVAAEAPTDRLIGID